MVPYYIHFVDLILEYKTTRWAGGTDIDETSKIMMEAGADLCFPSGSAPVEFLERISNFQNHSAELRSLHSAIDVKELEELFGRELHDFIKELILSFQRDWSEIVHHPKNIVNIAHKIKGSARNGRCHSVATAASDLETLFKQRERPTKSVEARALQKLYYAIKNLRPMHQ